MFSKIILNVFLSNESTTLLPVFVHVKVGLDDVSPDRFFRSFQKSFKIGSALLKASVEILEMN